MVRNLFSPLASMLLLAFILVACQTQTAEQPAPAKLPIAIEAYRTVGSPGAPVTIVEFSDYECPFCKKFTTEILPSIKEQYVDTGKVRFVFSDFPLEIHPNARAAAIAARCAGEQNAYFAYHDRLFANSKNLSHENFLRIATDLGLDVGVFSQCLDDQKHQASLDADIGAAKELGVKGTPSFLVNGQLVTGAQPFSVFQAMIEREDVVAPPETVGQPVCANDVDCGAGRTFPAYCAQSTADEFCTTSATPRCSLPGTSASECVTIIVENCTKCPPGTECENGACV